MRGTLLHVVVRNLIIIPTMHDLTETHPVYAMQSKMIPQWSMLQEAKNLMWQSIDSAIMSHSADIPHWKVFAEGVISLTPRPQQMFLYAEAKQQVEESSPIESRQNALVTSLWLAGATFVPTDDPQAYEKTFAAWNAYQELGEQMESLDLDETIDYETQKKVKVLLRQITQLGQERDRHVGTIIDTHLQEGETGVLIFGALHNIMQFLSPTITVSFISDETKKFWELLQDPKFESLYDAVGKFLEMKHKWT